MIWMQEGRIEPPVQQTVERILSMGQVSRREHLQLTSALLSDRKITMEERRLINHLLDSIQMGRLKIVNDPLMDQR